MHVRHVLYPSDASSEYADGRPPQPSPKRGQIPIAVDQGQANTTGVRNV